MLCILGNLSLLQLSLGERERMGSYTAAAWWSVDGREETKTDSFQTSPHPQQALHPLHPGCHVRRKTVRACRFCLANGRPKKRVCEGRRAYDLHDLGSLGFDWLKKAEKAQGGKFNDQKRKNIENWSPEVRPVHHRSIGR